MILKVEKGQDPYYVIERYIYEHKEVMEEMIAVLEIDGVRTNELLEVDSYYDGWIWLNDWWEGEPEIALIDYFPVSEACNPKTSIPIEWLRQKQNEHSNDGFEWIYDEIINEWEREKQNDS